MKHTKLQIGFICLMLHDFFHKLCERTRETQRSSPKNCVSRLCNRRQPHQYNISSVARLFCRKFNGLSLFKIISEPNKACCTSTATHNKAVLCMHRNTHTHAHTLDLFLSLFCYFYFLRFICGACMHYTTICKHVLMRVSYKQAVYHSWYDKTIFGSHNLDAVTLVHWIR